MRLIRALLHVPVVLLARSSSASSWDHGVQDGQGLHAIPTTSTTSSTSIAPSSITPAISTPSCWPQNESPGLGYVSGFCKCWQDESRLISLPEITLTPQPALNNPSKSCAYTAIPSCLTCTSMGQYQGECKTIENCQSGETSATTSTAKNRGKQGIASATSDNDSSSSAESTATITKSIFLTGHSSSPKSSIAVDTTITIASESRIGTSPMPGSTSTNGLSAETDSSPTSGTPTKESSSSTTDAPATTTDPLCWTQNQSPHVAGIVSPYCKCPRGGETLEYPLTTPTSSRYVPASACLYKIIPTCLGCTRMGHYGGKCTSIPGCTYGPSTTSASDHQSSIHSSPVAVTTGRLRTSSSRDHEGSNSHTTERAFVSRTSKESTVGESKQSSFESTSSAVTLDGSQASQSGKSEPSGFKSTSAVISSDSSEAPSSVNGEQSSFIHGLQSVTSGTRRIHSSIESPQSSYKSENRSIGSSTSINYNLAWQKWLSTHAGTRRHRWNVTKTQDLTTGPSSFTMQYNTGHNSSRTNSTCLLQEAYCPYRDGRHALDGLRSECVLWDNSCKGDNESAIERFWDSRPLLLQNKCFLDMDHMPHCTSANPPGRMSALADAKKWMRTPECLKLHYNRWGDPNAEGVFQNNLYLNATCCGLCDIVVDKVDVYFWPDPGADTSCQSIIGDEVSSVADGATTDTNGEVYWGCTATLSPEDRIYPNSSTTIYTTATLTSVASMQFKTYLYNPWDESQCGNDSKSSSNDTLATTVAAASFSNSTRTSAIERFHTLRPRAHSLAAGPNFSIAIVGTHTLTSPTIYLEFHTLTAEDKCGSTSIPLTMLAFNPEELSTIVGPVGRRFSTSRLFNPADLPCPPQSIMYENWYKPLPGVPYRPFFAFPEKVRHIVPWFTACNAFFFNAFDPPRTLTPVNAMDPPTTTTDPQVPSQAAIPSFVQGSGPTKTPSRFAPGAPWFLQPGGSWPLANPDRTAFPGGEGKVSAAWNGNENGAFTFLQEGPVATSTPVRAENNIQLPDDPVLSNTPIIAVDNVQQPADPQPASQPEQGPGFWNPANGANAVLPDPPVKPTSVVPNVDTANGGAANNEPQAQPLVTRPAGGFRASPQDSNPQILPGQNTPQNDPSAGSPQGGNAQGLGNLVNPAPIPEVPSFRGSNPQGGSGQTGQSAANANDPSEVSVGSTSASNDTPNEGGNGLANVANTGQDPSRQGSNNQIGSNQQGVPALGNLIGPQPRPQIPGSQGSNSQDVAGQPAANSAQTPNEQNPNPLNVLGQNGQDSSNAQSGNPASQDTNPQAGSAQGGQNAANVQNGSGGTENANPGGGSNQGGQNPANVASNLQNPGALNTNPQDTSDQIGRGPGIVATPWQNPSAQGSNAQGQPGQSPADVPGIPQGVGSQGSNSPILGQGGQDPSSANGVVPAQGPGAQGSNPQAIPGHGGQTQGGQNSGNPGGSVQDSGAAGANPQSPQVGNPFVTTFRLGNQGNTGQITIPLGNERKPTNGIINGGQRPAAPVITVASQILTISDPSAIPILGTTIRPGGAAVDISGTPVSLAPSGNLVIGNPLPPAGPSSSVITIAGNIVTANPSSFDIAGTPVRAGGPRVTVSGVPVSLGSSGNLVVGDDTIPAAAPKPSVFTVGSVSFTANPTAFEVGGATVSAGGPGITVDNTPVSLNPQGSLVIASNTIPLQAPAPSVMTANGQALTLLPDSGVAVGGQTLRNGGQAATVAGVPISVGPAGLVMGFSTIPLPTPNPSAVTTNGVAVTFQSNSQIAVDGQILSVGGQAATVNGVPVTVGSAGVVIGPDTVPLPTATLPAVTTNGVAVTFQSNSQVAVDGQTLIIGGQAATVNGVPVSVGTAGVIIGSDTIPLQTPAPTPTTIITNGVTATIDGSGNVAVDGQTLSLGGQAATVNGLPVTVGTAGLIIGSDTIPLQTPAPTPTTITTNGITATIDGNGNVAVNGQALSLGGSAATINNMPITVAPNGLVIGSDTIPLQTQSPTPTAVSILTTDGQTLTFQASGRVAVGGTTLSVGGQDVTVGGEVVSVATDGVVIGSETVPVPGGGAATSAVNPFEAGVGALRPWSMVVLCGILGVVLMVLI